MANDDAGGGGGSHCKRALAALHRARIHRKCRRSVSRHPEVMVTNKHNLLMFFYVQVLAALILFLLSPPPPPFWP